MNEFIWRPKVNSAEPYFQSRKEDNPALKEQADTAGAAAAAAEVAEQAPTAEQHQEKHEAITNHPKSIVDPNTFYDNNGVFRMSSSKREEVSLKMHDREPMSQRNQNPYLVQNNYIDDLETQQSFLMPKNSNFSDKKVSFSKI